MCEKSKSVCGKVNSALKGKSLNFKIQGEKMSKSFLKLVAIAFMAVGFVACGSDNQSSSLKESDSELLRVADLNAVKYQVLKKGANVNAKDKDGKTALMLWDRESRTKLALTHDLEMIKFLIEKGADLNAKDKNGWTALMHYANSGAEIDKIKFLVEKGADVNSKDKDGWTALMLFIDGEKRNVYINPDIDGVVAYLLKKGADVNAKTKNGWTALMFATKRSSHIETARQLLEKGAEVNAKNKNGWTALMFAATSNIDIVKLLLEKGADVNAKNKDGKTAVDIADGLGRKATRDILLKTMGIGE